MITKKEARATLLAALRADPRGLQDAVEQTLERAFRYRNEGLALSYMLGALIEHLGLRGLPRVSEAEEDLTVLEFWSVLIGEPIPWDPYGGEETAARSAWRAAVEMAQTEMGFREWWADRIETARHNL